MERASISSAFLFYLYTTMPQNVYVRAMNRNRKEDQGYGKSKAYKKNIKSNTDGEECQERYKTLTLRRSRQEGDVRSM